ncbi:unnamed protein product, partial [Pylaiella littoralis]
MSAEEGKASEPSTVVADAAAALAASMGERSGTSSGLSRAEQQQVDDALRRDTSEFLGSDQRAAAPVGSQSRVVDLEHSVSGIDRAVDVLKNSLSDVFPQLGQLGAQFTTLAADVAEQLADVKEALQQLAARGAAVAGTAPSSDEARAEKLRFNARAAHWKNVGNRTLWALRGAPFPDMGSSVGELQ